MERREIARVVAAGVFTVAALWGLFLLHSPKEVQRTEVTVVMGGEAQSSVPSNATVYGQSNLTAEEYKLFREKILGERFFIEEEGSQIPEGEMRQELRRDAAQSFDLNSKEVRLLQDMVVSSYQADFLQADGHYYPVETTQDDVTISLPFSLLWLLGSLVAIVLILVVDGVLLAPIGDEE